MAEQIIVDTPVSVPEPSEAIVEPWEKVGLTKEKYAEVFAELKTKVDTLRPEARKATELEAELTKLREADDKRKAAEMSDLEKAQAELQKSVDNQTTLQAQIDKMGKDIVYERAVSKRLAGYTETDRDLVRSLYDAAGTFADEDELNGLLDTIDTKWKTHLDSIGGGERPPVGGSTRGMSRADLAPVTQDEAALAEVMRTEGVAGMLKRKFASK